MTAHAELIKLIPSHFDTITDGMVELLGVFGEDRCEELLSVCAGYTTKELDFLFFALLEEMSRTTFYGFKNLSEGKLTYSYQLVLTAAHAAPVATAFNLDRQNVRSLMHSAGEVINITRTDSIVIDIPDMRRHKTLVLSGAVCALGTTDPYKCSTELLLFMGEHWRDLAPHHEMIASMPDFDIRTAIHLAEGGPMVLVDGVL